jgi:hypothetical protein
LTEARTLREPSTQGAPIDLAMIVHPSHPRGGRFSIPGLAPLAGDPLASALAKGLDDAYRYLRHAAAGGADPIDAIVVGPGGTWSLTLAVERGRFRKRNGHWYRWNRSTDSWIPWAATAVTAARLAGHRLELLLERAGLPSTVEACLCAGHGSEVSWEADQQPGVHVHHDLERLARRIARDEILTDAQVDRIVAVLDPRQPLPRLAPSTPHT